MKRTKWFVLIRILIGGIFIVSGGEKLLQPYQNFLYVIQGYEFLNNAFLEKIAAHLFPWMEYGLGGLLLLGLWLKFSIIGVGLFTTSFIVVVGQAILRNLPVTDCGCFGDLLSVPLPVILGMDIAMGAGLVVLFRFYKEASCLSLDHYFLK